MLHWKALADEVHRKAYRDLELMAPNCSKLEKGIFTTGYVAGYMRALNDILGDEEASQMIDESLAGIAKSMKERN